MNHFRSGFVRRCWLLALLSALGAPRVWAEAASLETVEKSAGDWLKVRAETARLETEWSTQRQLLGSIVHGLEERAQTLETKRDYLRAKTARERDELATLEAANRSATTNLRTAEEQLTVIGPRLLQLRGLLPPRLSEALDLPYKSLAAPDLSLSERSQLTMTVLNRCLQFNRSILCEDQILNIGGDGQARQLEVVYWGLSHAYALDRPAGKVWFGSPGPTSWQWEPLPGAAAGVAKLIAISRGKAEPEFVEVPGTVKNQPAAAAVK